MAELSDEEIDVVDVDQDEQDDPEPNRSFSGLSSILYFILCSLFYLYVLSCLFLTMVIPTSIAPILNHPVDINMTSDTINTTDKNESEAMYIGTCLLRNGGLLLLFLVQHSFFPRQLVKDYLSAINMSAFLRSVYVFVTCITLQVIHYYWTPLLPKYHLWNCSYDSTAFFVVMTTIHLFCWASVAFSLFTFDYLELFGIKQLYYNYLRAREPITYKSLDHLELLNNMRHPLFIAPVILLFGVPLMTYDRLLVSVMMPAYLLWGNKITDEDNFYIQDMYRKKANFLLHGKKD